jgi:hypothetical protein
MLFHTTVGLPACQLGALFVFSHQRIFNGLKAFCRSIVVLVLLEITCCIALSIWEFGDITQNPATKYWLIGMCLLSAATGLLVQKAWSVQA